MPSGYLKRTLSGLPLHKAGSLIFLSPYQLPDNTKFSRNGAGILLTARFLQSGPSL